ncbi:hypothetical protein FNV43_RR08800 [Rhamnella rubrinervis]|uniref:Uncharacterized protein n=1 Tax=Rhamnella rubrinervis TaxID=2594499 RepID=A0A8K0H8Z6_9ROSA|nr:hypothetical protein FNV43_RR08800 [Rhamnella rubrinervis]
MGQVFSRLSCTVPERRDMPVVEPVARRGVTLRGESSLGSYTDSDSTQHELEGWRQQVAMLLRREAVMIPVKGGDYYYMPIGRFQQIQEDHFHDMYMWYLDQFDEDLTKQGAMQARGYEGPLVIVAEPVEDDIDEDPEEDSLGTNDYIPPGYMHEPIDPEDFDTEEEPTSD